MILLTYKQAPLDFGQWKLKALAKAGLTVVTLGRLLDLEELDRSKVYLCPVEDLNEDLRYVSTHLLEHPRVLFHLSKPEDIELAITRQLPYVLISPKPQDETLWKLACGYDELTEDQQKDWDRDWYQATVALARNSNLSTRIVLKNEKTTLDQCLPMILDFL